MTIGSGSKIEISLNMLYLSQQCAMVFQYEVVDFPTTPAAVAVAEAWWNNVKVSTRALAMTTLGSTFKNVKIRELNNPAGDYATFDIPTAEQAGTRSTGSGDNMPPYVSTAVQLVVGSRLTRPGQKRPPFVTEGDNANGNLGASLLTATQTWAGVMTSPFNLGAPAALSSLRPIIVKKDDNGFVTAFQPITGYIVSPYLSTQNSRKIGRGI